MDEILKIEHLTKRFVGLVAVDDLSLTVHKREIHTLIGPNGAGKSTTINLITGVYKPDTGIITFAGQNITKALTYEVAQKGLGRTFQNIKLFSAMTVIENLMSGAHKNASQGIVNFVFNPRRAKREEESLRARAEEVLRQVDLYRYKDENVDCLPYGLRKMTELGRTLMTEPKMILLDEPAAGLNPSERHAFIQKLREVFDSGIDLLLIEHNMDIVMSISDFITVINYGAKLAEGSPKDIVNNPEVIKAYLGERFNAGQN